VAFFQGQADPTDVPDLLLPLPRLYGTTGILEYTKHWLFLPNDGWAQCLKLYELYTFDAKIAGNIMFFITMLYTSHQDVLYIIIKSCVHPIKIRNVFPPLHNKTAAYNP